MTDEATDNQTEIGNEIDDTTDLQMPSELDMLKQRAKLLNIPFSNNIGLEALRARVNAKINGDAEPAETTAGTAETNALSQGTSDAVPEAPAEETKPQMRARLRKEALRLVRLRITNLDPKKKDLPGEIITIANEFIGTVRKYVPFGEMTDNGYHVPYIIYEELKERRFLDIRTSKRGGQIHVQQNWAREFALEVLPQLTEQELARLAAAQAAAGSVTSQAA
jgi:hypothetical protein